MRVRGGGIVAALITIIAGFGLVASSALGAAGEIAYRCNNNDICVVDPDAPANVVNLSFNDATSAEGYPFWSPDGKKVGFTSNFKAPSSTGPENLYAMDPNAPGQAINGALELTHYTGSAAAVREAAWSPDGSKVAYQYETGGTTGVYVVNADGTSATPTTISAIGTSAREPTFSPDGTKIAYSIGQQVYIENADGSSASPQPLANGNGHSPAWSPDGTKIAFDAPQATSPWVDVHIVNVDGTGTPVVKVLTTVQFTDATWSPDGKRIAYRVLAPTGESYFHVMNADGTGDVPMPIVQNQNDNQAPSWSPDGSRLVFSAFNYGSPGQTDDVTEVNLTKADGTGSTTTLTTGGVAVPVAKGNADAIWRPSKVVTPPVQPPLPGPTIKPKLVWITKRIPWQPGAPLITIVYYCPANITQAACAAKLKGTSTGGGHPRLVAAHKGSQRGKKPVVVSLGQAKIPAGKTKKIPMKVTKAGKKLLLKRGSLKLSVTLTTTIAGQPKQVAHHTVRVYVKRKRG